MIIWTFCIFSTSRRWVSQVSFYGIIVKIIMSMEICTVCKSFSIWVTGCLIVCSSGFSTCVIGWLTFHRITRHLTICCKIFASAIISILNVRYRWHSALFFQGRTSATRITSWLLTVCARSFSTSIVEWLADLFVWTWLEISSSVPHSINYLKTTCFSIKCHFKE